MRNNVCKNATFFVSELSKNLTKRKREERRKTEKEEKNTNVRTGSSSYHTPCGARDEWDMEDADSLEPKVSGVKPS